MRSVLIVKHGALGDVVRTTSLIEPLRYAYGGPICWVTAPRAKDLLEGCPGVDRVISAGSSQAATLSRAFDLVLSLEEDPDAAALAQRCCRGELIGVYVREGRLYYTDSSALYYDMSLLNAEGEGALERANAMKGANRMTYAELWLKILGLAVPRPRRRLKPIVALSDSDRRVAKALARRHGLKAGRAIGVNPGAGGRWPSKQVSVEKAAALIGALGALRRPILLLGGEDDAERNRRIAAALPPGAVIVPAPAGLKPFAALLELCAVVVVTDSLALHLATALSRAVVALVGPTSAAELDVFGRGEKLVAPRGCGCFYKPRCQRPKHCLDEIPERAVVRAVRRWLN